MEESISILKQFKTEFQEEVVNVYRNDESKKALIAFNRWEERYKRFLRSFDQEELVMYNKFSTNLDVLYLNHVNSSYGEFMERLGNKIISSIDLIVEDMNKDRKLTKAPLVANATGKASVIQIKSEKAILEPAPAKAPLSTAKIEQTISEPVQVKNMRKYIDSEPEITTIFIDTVKFSQNKHDVRIKMTKLLNDIVKSFIKAEDFNVEEGIILIPTGDGVAISIKTNKAEYAIDLASNIKKEAVQKELAIRIGLHKAQDTIVLDINSHVNLCGPGIIGAQRIMDFGSAHDILVSESVYASIADRKGKETFSAAEKRADKHGGDWTFHRYLK